MTGTNGRNRVVDTGMGTVNPLAMTLDAFADSLIEGRSASHAIEAFPTDRINTKFACLVPGFDPTQFMDRKQVGRSARFTQLAVASAQLALADSGLELDQKTPFGSGSRSGPGSAAFRRSTKPPSHSPKAVG